MHSHHHLAPLLVAVGAGAVAWLVAHALKLNQRVRASNSGRLEGFAGLLAFLAAMQWLAVLHGLGDFGASLAGLERQSTGPYGRAGAIAAVIVRALVFVFVLWSAVMMHRKSRLFPLMFRIEMGLLVALPVALALLGVWAVEHGADMLPAARAASWIRVALFAPAAGLGFVYSLRSQRFRNTFVR